MNGHDEWIVEHGHATMATLDYQRVYFPTFFWVLFGLEDDIGTLRWLFVSFNFWGSQLRKMGWKKQQEGGNFRKKSGFRQQEHRARKSGKNWTRHGDAHPQTVGIMLIPIWSNLDIFNGHDWSVTNGWCSTTLIWSILWADHRFFRSIFIWDRLGLVGTFKIFGINKNLKSQNQSRWVPGHPQC